MKLERRQVKKAVEKWRKILQIEPRWNITFDVRNNSSEMSEGHEDSMACIDVDLRYFSADIEFNASEIDNEAELDATVLHELLHIIIEPLACSSACGLGQEFEEMSSILSESTIERLLPGYLTLYSQSKPKKRRPSSSSIAAKKRRKKK